MTENKYNKYSKSPELFSHKTCKLCQTSFQTEPGKSGAKYCSETCRKRGYKQTADKASHKEKVKTQTVNYQEFMTLAQYRYIQNIDVWTMIVNVQTCGCGILYIPTPQSENSCLYCKRGNRRYTIHIHEHSY